MGKSFSPSLTILASPLDLFLLFCVSVCRFVRCLTDLKYKSKVNKGGFGQRVPRLYLIVVLDLRNFITLFAVIRLNFITRAIVIVDFTPKYVSHV